MNRLIVLVIAVLLSSGCVNNGQFAKQDVAMSVGVIAGALLGNQIGKGNGRKLATLAGAVAGAYIGSSVGRYMDKQDQSQVARSLETAPDHRTTRWVNPYSGNRFSVAPTRTYQARGSNNVCREYTTSVVIDGVKQRAYGHACRQYDGAWKISS